MVTEVRFQHDPNAAEPIDIEVTPFEMVTDVKPM